MLIKYLYIALACICCACGAVLSGWDGRWAGALIMLTIVAGRTVGAYDLDLARSPSFKFCLDGALLLALITVMLRSRRWWPIWLVGLQVNATLAHVAALLVPTHTPSIYRGLQSFWGIPLVMVLAVGPLLDRAAELARRPENTGTGEKNGRPSASTRSRSDAGG